MAGLQRTNLPRRPFDLRLLLVALVGVLASACGTTDREPDGVWASAEIESPSRDVLWNVGMLAIQQYDFPRGIEVDPGTMTMQSGWKVQLSSFRGQGWRKQVELRFESIGPGFWKVDARVKKQKNMAVVRQLDPSYADWKWEEDDQDQARVVLQYIRSSLTVSR